MWPPVTSCVSESQNLRGPKIQTSRNLNLIIGFFLSKVNCNCQNVANEYFYLKDNLWGRSSQYKQSDMQGPTHVTHFRHKVT